MTLVLQFKHFFVFNSIGIILGSGPCFGGGGGSQVNHEINSFRLEFNWFRHEFNWFRLDLIRLGLNLIGLGLI